jgi:hypothetical protein
LWALLVLTFLQGAGMANVIAPTTESIISAMPPQQAGVGSAVSNIFRQVGGALGVAILGSVLSAVYRRQVTGPLSVLDEPARSVASESIAGAYGVAAGAGPAAPGVLEAANAAFITAMHWAAGGSAVVAGVAAVLVYAFLPRHADPLPEPTDVREPPPRRSGDDRGP